MSGSPAEFRPAAPLRPVLRTRESAFSYECRACGRCCRDKLIPVNPYEVARLAAHLGMGTTEFLAHYTEGGTALAVREDITCIFLENGGCAVHADRPLACRLYPLGLVTVPEGEAVVELEAQAGSEAIRGENGTVAQYFEAQGVAPFLDASHRYHGALDRLIGALSAACGAETAASTLQQAPAPAPEILDLDAALAALGRPVPDTIEERVRAHLEYLEQLAVSLERGGTS